MLGVRIPPGLFGSCVQGVYTSYEQRVLERHGGRDGGKGRAILSGRTV
jgi:hypothetical protein